MENIFRKNAGLITMVTAMVFSSMMWSYSLTGYAEGSTYLIVAGVGFIILNSMILWLLLTTKKASKKKGKKGNK
jgi:multidrug transporter EmrE-like cation transporter